MYIHVYTLNNDFYCDSILVHVYIYVVLALHVHCTCISCFIDAVMIHLLDSAFFLPPTVHRTSCLEGVLVAEVAEGEGQGEGPRVGVPHE